MTMCWDSMCLQGCATYNHSTTQSSVEYWWDLDSSRRTVQAGVHVSSDVEGQNLGSLSNLNCVTKSVIVDRGENIVEPSHVPRETDSTTRCSIYNGMMFRTESCQRCIVSCSFPLNTDIRRVLFLLFFLPHRPLLHSPILFHSRLL
jgi:hypothetical protein